MSRRAALGRLAAGCGALAAGCGAPAEPVVAACPGLAGGRVRWLVGAAPGGTFDQLSRVVEPALEDALNVQVTVENLTGAGGLICAHRIARARPDGRTAGLLSGAGLLVLPYVSPEHALDPERDFDVLARVGAWRPTLAVAADLGVRTLEDMLRRREALVLGRSGPLSSGTLIGPALGAMFGLEVRLVAGYTGATARIAAARRGETDGLVADEDTVARASGLIPVLRLTQSRGSSVLPEEVPALAGPGSFIETHRELFRDPVAAQDQAAAIETLAEIGRIAVAPAGLSESLRLCLESAVFDAAASPGSAERARAVRRAMAPLPAAETRRAIRAGREAAARLRVMVEDFRRGAVG